MTDISPEAESTVEVTESVRETLLKNYQELQDNEVANDENVSNDEVNEAKEQDTDNQNEEPENQDNENEAEEQEEPVLDIYKAPTNWNAKEKELFDKLPDDLVLEDGSVIEIKEILTKYDKSRNADYTRKTQELAEQKKEVKGLVELIEPYKGEFEQQRVNPADYFRDLMNTATALHKDPVNTVKAIMDRFNVTPENLGITQSADNDSYDDEDDYLTDLEKENKQLKQRLDNLENQFNVEQSNSRKTREDAHVNKMISEFENAQDDNGQLKHPYFSNEEVRQEMAVLYGAGNDLEEAYSKSPTVKRLEFEAKSKETPEQKATRKRMEINQAKKASRRVDTSTIDEDLSSKSQREHLMANFKRFNNN